MNLDNVKVPNEAERAEMETTAEVVRGEMKAAAESATGGDRPEHSGQVRMAYRLEGSYAASSCTFTASAGWHGTDGVGRRMIPACRSVQSSTCCAQR